MKNQFFTLLLISLTINFSYAQVAKILNYGQAIHFTSYNNKLYYSAGIGGTDVYLYETDGTPFGTRPIKRTLAQNPNASKSTPFPMLKNRFYFVDAHNGFWASDGTDFGTKLIKQFPFSTNSLRNSVTALHSAYDRIYIQTHEVDYTQQVNYDRIWVSDGTEAGTFKVIENERKSSSGDYFKSFKIVENAIFFNDGSNESNLWFSDGTVKNSRKIYDFSNQPCIYGVHSVRKFKNQYIFRVGCNNEIYIWMMDTTTFIPKRSLKTSGALLETINDKILYAGENNEIWVSDGIANTEKPLIDADRNKVKLYQFGNFELWQNAYYFIDDQRRLWKTNGVPQGTMRLTDYPLSLSPTSRDSNFLYWDSKTDFLKIDKNGKVASIFKHGFFNGDDSNISGITVAGSDIYFWEYAGLRVYNGITQKVESLEDFKNDFGSTQRGVYPISNRKAFISGSKNLQSWGQFVDELWLFDLQTKQMDKVSLEQTQRQSIYNAQTKIFNNKLFFTGSYSTNSLQPYITYSVSIDTLTDKTPNFEDTYIYPNPSVGEFNVCSTDFQILNIEVYNIMGNKIEFVEKPLNLRCKNIYIAKKGMFLVKSNFGGKFHVQKVFIR